MYSILVPILKEKGVVNLIGSYCGPKKEDVKRSWMKYMFEDDSDNSSGEQRNEWLGWEQLRDSIGENPYIPYDDCSDEDYVFINDHICCRFGRYFWNHYVRPHLERACEEHEIREQKYQLEQESLLQERIQLQHRLENLYKKCEQKAISEASSYMEYWSGKDHVFNVSIQVVVPGRTRPVTLQFLVKSPRNPIRIISFVPV